MQTEFININNDLIKEKNINYTKIKESEENKHIQNWENLGWEGPQIGKHCSISTPILSTPKGNKLYCYMETVKLIEKTKNGSWIGKIDNPKEIRERSQILEDKQNNLVILETLDIWIP